MSEGTAIPFSKIEPLNDKNYYVWALKVSAVLRARKLFAEVIEGEEPLRGPNPESEAGKKRLKWETKNDEAFGILVTTLSDAQAGQFLTENKAKTVWEVLKRTHAGKAEDRRIDIALELKNITMQKNESVVEYIIRAKSIASRSASIGHPFEDRELSYHVVRGVHSRFEKVAVVLRAQRLLNLEDVQQVLEEEERRINQETSSKEHGSQSDPKDEKAYKAYRSNQRNQTKYSGCFICGKKNHRAIDCYHRKDRDDKKPTRGRNYTNKSGEASKDRSNKSRREYTGLATEEKEEHSYNVEKQTHRENKQPHGSEIWTLDSGSSTHMSPDIERMRETRPFQTKVNLAEDARALMSRARGNIEVSTDTNDGEVNLLIKDVLYIPGLRGNLLSVSQLCKNGHKIVFENHGAKVIGRHNEIIAEAREENGIYVVKTGAPDRNATVALNIREDTSEENQLPSTSQKSDKMLWHRRLGHACENYVDEMRNTGAVRDLSYKQEKLGICEPCVMGKLTQVPHKRVNDILAEEPLELIHMDVCGPMPVESLNGNRYVYVIIDEYSRYTTIYLMKTKEETYNCFLEYKNKSKNLLRKKIRNVRSDNGREFVNKKFEEL